MSDEDDFSVDSCRRAVESGDAGAWVRRFLASDGSDNAELGRQLERERSEWYGPVRIDFDELHRLAGPADQPTMDRMDDDDRETARDMAEGLRDGWEPPPVIATWKDDHLSVEDGNHRIEGMRSAGMSEWWTLVGFDDDSDRGGFFASLAEPSTDEATP